MPKPIPALYAVTYTRKLSRIGGLDQTVKTKVNQHALDALMAGADHAENVQSMRLSGDEAKRYQEDHDRWLDDMERVHGY